VAVSRDRLNEFERAGNFGNARNRLRTLRACQNRSRGGTSKRQECSTIDGSQRRPTDWFIVAHFVASLKRESK
jgi:hypothetical protein